jgi:hypothetical protein
LNFKYFLSKYVRQVTFADTKFLVLQQFIAAFASFCALHIALTHLLALTSASHRLPHSIGDAEARDLNPEGSVQI